MSRDDDLAGVFFTGFLVGVPLAFLQDPEEHLEHKLPID